MVDKKYHIDKAERYARAADIAYDDLARGLSFDDDDIMPAGPFGQLVTMNVGLANMHLRMAEFLSSGTSGEK